MINFGWHGHLCWKIIAGSKGMLTIFFFFFFKCAVCVNIRHDSFCQREVCVSVCERERERERERWGRQWEQMFLTTISICVFKDLPSSFLNLVTGTEIWIFGVSHLNVCFLCFLFFSGGILNFSGLYPMLARTHRSVVFLWLKYSMYICDSWLHFP